MFDPEVIGDAFLIDVTELDDGRAARRPADGQARRHAEGQVMAGVHELHARPRAGAAARSSRVTAQVFENGVLDRLTVETGLVTVTADLQSLEMRSRAELSRDPDRAVSRSDPIP